MKFIAPTMQQTAGTEQSIMVGDTDIGAAFGSITDESSARAALPDLAVSNDRPGEIGGMVGSLGEGQQGDVSGMARTAFGAMRPVVEKAIAIPGADPIVAPVPESMIEKFGAMAG